MAQILLEPRRGDSGLGQPNCPGPIREQQYLGQPNPLDVLNAERELVGTGVKRIEARRILARAACATLASLDGRKRGAESSRHAALGRPANQGRSAQYGQMNPSHPWHIQTIWDRAD
jgi:hypothetical protein